LVEAPLGSSGLQRPGDDGRERPGFFPAMLVVEMLALDGFVRRRWGAA
jgi:hypothetical protein